MTVFHPALNQSLCQAKNYPREPYSLIWDFDRLIGIFKHKCNVAV